MFKADAARERGPKRYMQTDVAKAVYALARQNQNELLRDWSAPVRADGFSIHPSH
jgi:hypothetical protein